MGNVRRTWMAVLLCIAAVAMPAWPAENREYRLDIDRQPLAQALEEFSEQTELSYGIFGIRIGEQLVGPLRGRYTAEAALRALLKGTGLTFSQANDGGITLLAEASVPRPKGASAVAEQRPAAEEPRMAVRSAKTDPEAPAGLLDEMIVTGTRVRTIRQPAPATLVVLGHERLQEMGVSNAGELLSRLTQQPYFPAEAHSAAGAQFASLRGLGGETTVILIDGRRAFPSASTVFFGAFDLNTIPLAAVERVEVLADSASAVYGADAIGGIINFILKKRISDSSLDLDYSFADGGAEGVHAAMSTGGSIGPARASLVLDYVDRKMLLGAERERWRDQDFRRYGGADWRSQNASPGNVTSLQPGNLPGLSASYAAVPPGGSADYLTPADFTATAGERNYASLYRYRTILPARQRASAVAQLDVPLGLHDEVFMDLLYRNESVATEMEPASLSRVIVPAENPFNPFGVPVAVDALLTALGPRTIVDEVELLRVGAGLRGQRSRWSWEVSLVHSADDGNFELRNDVDPAQMRAALAATDPAQALNLFGGRAGSSGLLASLRAEPTTATFGSDGTQALAVVQGPTLLLPAGDLMLVAGGEWRREYVAYAYEPLFGLSGLVGAHDRSVSAAFTELLFPLVNERMNVWAARDLTLKVAARLDSYDRLSARVNPHYELRWSSMSGLSARATFARGYRPPALFDLYAPRLSFVSHVIDPRRDGEVVAVEHIGGGNPRLRSPEADMWTAGVTFERPDVHNLRLAMTLWRVDLDNRVSAVPAEILLAFESEYPGRVVRREPSAEDLASGRPGRIESIDMSRLNFGDLKTDGIDLAASATFDAFSGRITPQISATWVNQYRGAELPGAPKLERVNLAHRLGTIPRWRVIAELGWKRAGFGVNVMARHTPAYDDAFVSQRTGRRVQARTVMDAQMSLDFDRRQRARSQWSGVAVRVGMTNVFDEEPPFTESAGPIGYDLTQGDLTGRIGYVQISKRF